MNGVLIKRLEILLRINEQGINRTSYQYCKGYINGVLIEHLTNIGKDILMGY